MIFCISSDNYCHTCSYNNQCMSDDVGHILYNRLSWTFDDNIVLFCVTLLTVGEDKLSLFVLTYIIRLK